MDAHAHLLSLGWAGPGHALDSKPYKQKGHRGLAYDPSKSSNTGNGLVKPLLVSQRKGRLGIGKKTHEPQAGNEWWLKGFESALGNIGKSESERTSGASTPVPYSSNGGKHTGLYSFFTKGQQMAGTIGEDGGIIGSKKRKAGLLGELHDQEEDSSESHQTNTIYSKRLKPAPAIEFELVSKYIALRDKDETRQKKHEKLSPVTEFRQVGEYMQARSEKGTKKRKRQAEEEDSEAATTPLADNDASMAVETKEERRERRRRRREEKAKKRSEGSKHGSSKSKLVQSDDNSEEDPAAKSARRAERKKRKADKAARLLE